MTTLLVLGLLLFIVIANMIVKDDLAEPCHKAEDGQHQYVKMWPENYRCRLCGKLDKWS